MVLRDSYIRYTLPLKKVSNCVFYMPAAALSYNISRFAIASGIIVNSALDSVH